MTIDAEIAAARERLHRSIGQRARWAMVAIRERVELERDELDYLFGFERGWFE